MSRPIPPKLQKALSALLALPWRFEDRPSDAEWEPYVLGLMDQHYGRELSEQEEEYERARWQRAQLMLKNLDAFRCLIEATYRFVLELTEVGGQRILATRAALPPLDQAAQPSEWVRFGPLSPPDPPPLEMTKYEQQVGGPHILGARLIWWCAAATVPKDFGFSRGFSQSLWTQPIWATAQGELIRANEDSVSLMKEAASKIADLLASDVVADATDADDTSVAEAKDGPCLINQFHWKGQSILLTNDQWLLVDLLWKQRHWQVHYNDAIQHVFGGDTTDSAVTTAASRISKAFKKAGMPLKVRTRRKYVFLAVEED